MKCNLVFILATISIASGYKILFLVPISGPSHWFLMQNFVKELVVRGHEVTAIVNKPISNFKSPNYTEVLIDLPFDLTSVALWKDMYKKTEETDFVKVFGYEMVCTPSSEHGLKSANVQKIIHSKNLHFDLVINEEIFHESWLMFGYKFSAPIVTISPLGYLDHFDRSMGLLTPWSHVPHMLLPYGDDMTYFQRVYNVIISAFDWWHRNWITLPNHDALAQKYFGHLAAPGKPLPSIADLYHNVSLILVVSHRSMSVPRPMMPGIVYIAGAHIKPPKPVPTDLQEFMDDSEHGVIIFSLGSLLQSSRLPKGIIDTFADVFGKLKQRVIWKFEDESLTVSANVLVRKWLPQSDILAHPNVVLFITHGGMSGYFEGSARGVPMLFIPFFGDQRTNALKSVASGNARMLSLTDITHETLTADLKEILSNESYMTNAKELARNFNDNLVHPMDEAMFWIEYVIRSRGAKHLKSYAVNMSWFSYSLLDVFLLPILAVMIIILACRRFFRIIVKATEADGEDKKNN